VDSAAFWDVIEARRLDLSGLGGDERAAFAAQWRHHLDVANTRPLRDAANLLLGWPTEAEFLDFRRWLLTRGRAVFTAAVADPDTLADAVVLTPVLPDAASWEGGRADGEPSGEWTNLADRRELRATFPRLAARFEGGCR
jgi:hypothetical protein